MTYGCASLKQNGLILAEVVQNDVHHLNTHLLSTVCLLIWRGCRVFGHV